MKPRDLIGKHLRLEGQFEGQEYYISGVLKEVTTDHLIFQETTRKGLTYWSKAITILIVGVLNDH